MPQEQTLRVKGYKELLRACDRAGKATKKEVRGAFREVGEGVRRDAARRIQPVNSRTAAGYKVRVRQRGIAVEQSIRKTTGLHPEFGKLQMRTALIPALDANEQFAEREMDKAIDKIATIFAI